MTYRSVNVLVLAALLLSLAAPVAAAPEAAIPAQRPVPGQPGARNDVPALRAQAPVKPSTARNRAAGEVIGETDPGGASPAIYIARLDGAPLASYAGGVDSLPATSPVATGAAALDVGAVASTAYLGYLGSQQVTALDAINRALGRNVEVKFVYSYAFNGFALVLTPAEARIVAQQAGVRSVERDFLRQPVTDAGPTWVGAPGYWDGASTGGLGSTFGEGMVAGVIDTGINFASNSFAQVDAQGYRHTNPRGRFYGVCDPNSSQYNAAFICNSKLIGAWDFVDAVSNESDGPEDSDGHGSHTASTTAGNAVMATLLAPTTSYEARLSGVAPRANIIAYDACAVGCSGSALVRSIDQAVADGVDVINYSIGGGSSDPWLSADAIAFLGAHDAGIVAAVAAGNAGPSPSTMSSPANAPWVIASAAMTHDRVFANGVISMTGGAAPLADLPGKSVTAAYGPASIVDAANYTSTLGMADPLCQAPFAAGALSGKIVVCLRGVNGRVAKGENVLAGGAVGMVLVNDEASGYSLNADTHVLPAVHLTYANGLLLKAWLASGTGHTGRIAGTAPNRNEANGDILAAFSSRGPDATAPNILKPDIGAPGVDILAAYRHPISYNVVSGTSMASPHTAGAALLLAKLHPTWTPSEIKSALMLASKTLDLYRDDGVTPTSPFDVGAGRLKLETVAGVGFVLDERSLNYELANPGTGGDPSQLNLPSLQQEACVGTCSWTRTLKSVVQSAEAYAVTVSTPASMTLSVTPSSFTLPAGGSQVITITADVGAAAMDSWIFGQVNFRKQATSNVAEPLAHFPVAVMSRAGVVPNYLTEVSIETRRSAGSYIVSGIRALTTPTLQKAIYLGVPATVEGSIPPDPMNGEPYDPEAEGVIMAAVVITDPTTVRLAVQVLDTTAVDLDLFVGVDRNGDGRPTLDEELCRSTSASWTELCVLKNSPPGNYWVLLQNWQGSGAATDDFTMAITKVARGKSSAELTVSGPESTQLGTPFPVQINWDFVDLVEGNVVLALLELGTDAGNPNNIASLPVTLDRMRDDVAVAAISDNLVTGAYGLPGDLVTFTVSLEPEPTAIGPVDYRITATLPAGMTYVPGAAISRATGAEANVEPVVDGNRLIWTLPGIETAPQYVMSTNDPARNDYDPTCDTFLGGFIHLEDYGIDVRSEISGTGFAFSIDQFYGGTQPYNFFGTNHSQLYLTSNALLSVIGMDPALRTGANAPIPTAALPNSLMAPYWNAFRVVYDPLAQTGVRIAGALGGDVMVVEYDGLQSVANPAASFDVEAIVARQVRNDMPEIVFAYDGITGTLPAGVIGVENATGTGGVAFTGAIGDGLVICYDWKPDRAVLEYRARIDSNSATDVSKVIVHDHSLSAPGAKTAQAVQEIFVTGVVLGIGISGPTRLSPGVPISYTLTVSNTGSQAASNVNVRTVLPLGAEHVRGGTLDGRTVAWQIPSLPSGARAMVEYSVLMRNTPATAAMLPEVTASIVGGEEAEAGAWPWMAAIVNARTADTYAGQFCGGSLIHAEWVLTAAHCVTNRQGVPDVPSTIDVVVGRHDLTTSAGQRIPVGEIRVHPGYEVAAAFDADIALLHLAQPAVLTTTVQPIALLPNARAGLLQPNMPVTVTGWGTRTYNEPDYPAKLYQVVVPLFEQAVCRINYASAGAEITDNMLCAGMAQGGKDSCQGDSGGPLVVADGMGWLQAGIVSWGQACALPQLPGVYTRVDRFADWVNDESSTLSTGAFSAYTESLGDFGGHWVVGTGRIKTLVKPNITYLPAIKR